MGKTLMPSTTTASTTILPPPPPTTSTVTTPPIIKRFDNKNILQSDEGHERKMKEEKEGVRVAVK